MTPVFLLQFAGLILLCIVLANFFAPKKMQWSENLKKVDPVFRQVFIIHCIFLVGTVFAMALICIILPEVLLSESLGKMVLAFMAVFWAARVFVQFFYYERSIKKRFPIYNVLFSTAFLYLAHVFCFLTIYH